MYVEKNESGKKPGFLSRTRNIGRAVIGIRKKRGWSQFGRAGFVVPVWQSGGNIWYTIGCMVWSWQRGKGYVWSFFITFKSWFSFCLCWAFIAVEGLSLVAADTGCSSLRCAGSSWRWLLLTAEHRLSSRSVQARCSWLEGLWSVGSGVVLHALWHTGASWARNWTLNPCPPHWLAGS